MVRLMMLAALASLAAGYPLRVAGLHGSHRRCAASLRPLARRCAATSPATSCTPCRPPLACVTPRSGWVHKCEITFVMWFTVVKWGGCKDYSVLIRASGASVVILAQFFRRKPYETSMNRG
jgi:hypothetical protein